MSAVRKIIMQSRKYFTTYNAPIDFIRHYQLDEDISMYNGLIEKMELFIDLLKHPTFSIKIPLSYGKVVNQFYCPYTCKTKHLNLWKSTVLETISYLLENHPNIEQESQYLAFTDEARSNIIDHVNVLALISEINYDFQALRN